MPTKQVRETIQKDIKGIKNIVVDSSATVTIDLADDAKITKEMVADVIKTAKKKWGIVSFVEESRPLAVETYTLAFSGAT